MFSSPIKKFQSPIKQKQKELNSAEKKSTTLIGLLEHQIDQDNIDVFEKYPHIRQRIVALLEQFTSVHQLKEDNFNILQQKLQREITFQLNKLRNNNKISLLDNLYHNTGQSPLKSPLKNIRLAEGKGLSPIIFRRRAQSGMVEKDILPQERNIQRPKSSLPKKIESSPIKAFEIAEADEVKEELTATFQAPNLAEEEEMIGNNKNNITSSLPYSFLKMVTPETEHQSKDNEFYEEIKKILEKEEEYEKARARELLKLERQANEEISNQWQEQIELKKKEEQLQRQHSKEMRKNIDFVVQKELIRERESVSKKKRQAVEERIKACEEYKEEKRKAQLIKMEQINKERRELEQSMMQSQQQAQTNRTDLLNKQMTQQKLLADHSNLAFRIKQSQQQQFKDQQLKILKDGIAMQHERDSRQFQERYSLLSRGKKYYHLRQSVSPMKNV